MVAGMSRVGDCFDNAPKESFWLTLKKMMKDVAFATRAEARTAIFEYIEVLYNRQRIHGSPAFSAPNSSRLADADTLTVSTEVDKFTLARPRLPAGRLVPVPTCRWHGRLLSHAGWQNRFGSYRDDDEQLAQSHQSPNC